MPPLSKRETQSVDRYTDGTYLERHKDWHVEDSQWKADQVFKILKMANVQPRTVCEVGCGAGEILKRLSDRMPDSEFSGYEISPQAFEMCKKRTAPNIKYYLKNVLDDADAFFDCLLCIDVFEHVEDCFGFLKALKGKATYKVFHIPLDLSVLSLLRGSLMSVRDTAGHLHYFNAETARATLTDCGYQIVDAFYTTVFDLPQKSMRSQILRIPRKILFEISPDFAVRLIGGCSYMVLAT